MPKPPRKTTNKRTTKKRTLPPKANKKSTSTTPAREETAVAPDDVVSDVTAPEETPTTPSPEELDVQPAESCAPPTPNPVSDRAATVVRQLVDSYFGQGNTSQEEFDKILGALSAGHQPCVAEKGGNTRFEIKVFTQKFDRSDVQKDVTRRDGVVLNLARRLSDANLFKGG
tara:strand:- start:1267 stop:1779 length:513 start_codon:yes stop_codon:yes gene_type:complete